ncbi:MAG: bifunctional sulfate adenylyltransferase/adenylylsulfate kinase [Pyrinomonadaceae bacterium]
MGACVNPNVAASLVPPYGGKLVDLMASPEEADQLRSYANRLSSVQLSERAVCDLELLANGGFSPLDRFVGRADYRCILDEMRLVSGPLFPIPIALPVEPQPAIHLDQDVALRNAKNELLAVMKVEEIYEWDSSETAQMLLGSQDLRHPLVVEMKRWGRINIAGSLRVLQLPPHFDFQSLRLTPTQVRGRLEELRRPNVVAFQTRNPLHRAHEELTKLAMQKVDGSLLIHPVVGMTRLGDVDYVTRVRTYQAMLKHYDNRRTVLSLLPLAMRLAGPREALWHAIIRRNYGANYLIVGRDHASPGLNSKGESFFEPYAAQALVESFSGELGVGLVPFSEVAYVPDERRYVEISTLPAGTRTASISGKQLREDYLNVGRPLPEWFVRPEVAAILVESYPPRYHQGVCVWFTGLSGAGKSTTAEILTVLLQEHGRQVTVLDGDVVRTNLSRGLGFSKEDRDLNIRRIGFVAAEIVRHGGIAVCAAISPYRATRNDVRNMVGVQQFIEVFVDTPLEECERRDTKGMYASARRGEIKGFTGIDDPYEPPQHAEISLETMNRPPEENARLILDYLLDHGFIRSSTDKRSNEPGAESAAEPG